MQKPFPIDAYLKSESGQDPKSLFNISSTQVVETLYFETLEEAQRF